MASFYHKVDCVIYSVLDYISSKSTFSIYNVTGLY